MKNIKKTSENPSLVESVRSFRAGVLVALLLTIGAVTAIAKYESRKGDSTNRTSQLPQTKRDPVPNQLGNNYVTVEVAGKKLQVNAQTLQQGPLTQDQAQQLAAALKDNQSTDGLVQTQHSDGAVSVDLQDRFQNVVVAKKNADGSVSQACVDNSKAASAFLQSSDTAPQPGSGSGRKAPVKE